MKKLFAAILLVQGLVVFAAVANHEIIKPGEQKKIDVAYAPEVISFNYEMWTDDRQYPQVTVISEKGGFHCQVQSMRLTQLVERASHPAQQTYEVKVLWEPGTDRSSCELKISHPDVEDALLMLYMIY